MTYSSNAEEFDREHIYVVEIDLEYCSLTHGSAPCTATETGDAKCFNTRPTCNDLANYDDNLTTPTVLTYRFCSSKSPQPIGLDAIPSLEDIRISASKIDIEGGLGQRSSVSMTFLDHPSSDLGTDTTAIDKYISDRTYIALERGTFWTKLRARNINYQYRTVRVYSGFLVNGAYDVANFKKRTYIIESIDVNNGKASVTGKDPLKLAMSRKAQVPEPSTGTTTNNPLLVGDTTINLSTGSGAEYDTSGKVLIGNEVIAYTGKGTDTLTGCTRGQNNTTAKEHAQGSTVQQCYEQTAVNVDIAVADILKNFANVPASYIDDTAWANESSLYLEENINGIVVKPTDVKKVLRELAESFPHYLYWDEEDEKIIFSALKAPPETANQFLEDNVLAESLRVRDKPDMRYSTVFINIGQFDPTKKLDEESNYTVSWARIDSDSIASYGSNQVKKINSRWINSNGLGVAQKTAVLWGRRFSNVPREIMFETDIRYRISQTDGVSGLNAIRNFNHRDMTDFTGNSVDTLFQILSEQEMPNKYKYTALEFPYGAELVGDPAGGTAPIIIGADDEDVNLATLYNNQVGAISGDITVTFVVNNSVIVSSTSTLTPAMDMGDWSAATSVAITLQVNTGAVICGKGGSGNGLNGGLALNMTEDLTLTGTGTIGGGGGGGGSAFDDYATVGGGGGAGFGDAGDDYEVNDVPPNIISPLSRNPSNGFATGGGVGGVAEYIRSGNDYTIAGGEGGDLGQNGTAGDGTGGFGLAGGLSGGTAGNAIDRNSNTLTQTSFTGSILGSIIA